MSSTINNTATAGAQEPAAATPDSIIEQLRVVRQQIPEYTQLAIPDAKAIRRVAHIDSDFIDAASNAVGASDVVQTGVGRTNADLREENEDAGRWTAVEDELRAMLKGVVAANLVRAIASDWPPCRPTTSAHSRPRSLSLSLSRNRIRNLDHFGRTRDGAPGRILDAWHRRCSGGEA